MKPFNKRYTNYYLKPSARYKRIMYPWKNTSIQYNLMINETCDDKKFIIVK